MELISITDAAKRLGVNRSKLNLVINQHKLPKKKQGRVALVDYHQVQELVQKLAATGKIRTPTVKKTENNEYDLIEHFKEELKRVTAERNELFEKNKSLLAETFELRGELKLLKASEENHERKSEENIKNLSWTQKSAVIGKILFS